MATHQAVVAQLKTLLDGNPKMAADLKKSLIKAQDVAANGDKTTKPPTPPLNKDLYNAINKEFNQKGWPTTIEDYFDYLDIYVKLVPNEEISENYPKAWRSGPNQNGYNQKVYDLLCQFYWLVDPFGSQGRIASFLRINNELSLC